MAVSEATYRQIAIEDPDGQWELHCGRLRQKPPMTARHNNTMSRLFGWLFRQLDETRFVVRSNSGSLRRSAEGYYVPDIYVVPSELMILQLDEMTLESYDRPLPLVVEIWSPSTGEYDLESKIPEYRRRGDMEIWRIQPYERTLTAWVLQTDGGYTENVYSQGIIRPSSLPDVEIDLNALFN